MLAGWALLLLLGLAGGDPFAAGRPGREAPAIAFAKWLHRRWASRQPAAPPISPPVVALTPARRTPGSGFHPAV
jgi:hypothetical protein